MRITPKVFLFTLSLITISVLGITAPVAIAQSPSHPEAKSPLPDNPYLKYRDPWRWDIRTQVFLRAGVIYVPTQGHRDGSRHDEVRSVWWPMKDLEVIFPVVREGGFYWSPNESVEAAIRPGDFPREITQTRMYTHDTKAEYTLWKSDVEEVVHDIHITHNSHIVVADTVFDDKKARFLPWPDTWADEANAFLSPVVDSVGASIANDAEDTIKTLLDFWVEDKDPKAISELDLVKFLTGKVIEHVQVRGPPAEFSTRAGNRYSAAAFVGGTSWSGFVVRSGDVVARDPKGTKHDLATLLVSVLRSAGVPARTLLCVNQSVNDRLEEMVSMVEFAMYDPQRDITFWVIIDIDRLRLTGKRASQYKQWWNYFGTHDELNDYVPIAYYFHPPASYRAYDLPAFYGIRSTGQLPDTVIQSVLIDAQVSTVSVPVKGPSRQP